MVVFDHDAGSCPAQLGDERARNVYASGRRCCRQSLLEIGAVLTSLPELVAGGPRLPRAQPLHEVVVLPGDGTHVPGGGVEQVLLVGGGVRRPSTGPSGWVEHDDAV